MKKKKIKKKKSYYKYYKYFSLSFVGITQTQSKTETQQKVKVICLKQNRYFKKEHRVILSTVF